MSAFFSHSTPDPPNAVVGTVLTIDDHAPNRALMRRMLRRDGHEVLEASDGPTALQVAREARPDVILLDVIMPGMDGFDTCAALKRRPETRLTPMVLVTALRERQHRLRGIEANADVSRQ